MADLLKQLKQEHWDSVQVLGCLDRQTQKFDDGEPLDFAVVSAVFDYFEGTAEQSHHAKEDLVFARLSDRDQISAWIVGDMTQIHAQMAENLGIFIATIRAALAQTELPRDAFTRWVRGFIDLRRRHAMMEQVNFYPVVKRVLTSEDWRELADTATGVTATRRGEETISEYDVLRRAMQASNAQIRSTTNPQSTV
jgi:hemerythrin-like domain-containing protein